MMWDLHSKARQDQAKPHAFAGVVYVHNPVMNVCLSISTGDFCSYLSSVSFLSEKLGYLVPKLKRYSVGVNNKVGVIYTLFSTWNYIPLDVRG